MPNIGPDRRNGALSVISQGQGTRGLDENGKPNGRSEKAGIAEQNRPSSKRIKVTGWHSLFFMQAAMLAVNEGV